MIRYPMLLAASFVSAIAIAAMQPPASAVPDFIAAAIADPNRPAADKDRDASRKPAETVEFAGIKPGDKIAELLPGGGYFTRIFSKVVGSAGHVYALVPAPPPDAPASTPDFAARVKALAADPN
ncbi:MAG: methyltransferase, partial [Steroidobacteraceae bacterium]